MIRSIILCAALIFTNAVFAQNEYQTAADSDPEAKIILDNLKNKYDALKSLEVNFDLSIEFPGQSADLQKGLLIQQSDQYVLDFPDQKIYNNGDHLWLHLKTADEVQWYNASQFEESDDSLDPDRLLRLYETGEYVYAITFKGDRDGANITQIEFKPLDRDSEYIKMRLTVDNKKQFPMELTVFSKDGSRYALIIKDFKENFEVDAKIFTFDPKSNPDLYVEDLRM